MNDPYQILGVTRDASDREIKKAYRDLSRKYHPDSYAGKTEAEADAAAEKFKQVQEAYNRIVDERSGKATGSYGDFGGFGGFGAGQGRQNYSDDEQHMMAAMNYIRARRYNEALNVLNGISNHNAAWYIIVPSQIWDLAITMWHSSRQNRRWIWSREICSTVNITSSCKMAADSMEEAHLEVRLAAVMAVAEATVVMEVMAEDMIPVEPEISVVISGVPTRCVNVWEAIFVHACRAGKKNSRSGNVIRTFCSASGSRKFCDGKYAVFNSIGGISCGICYLSLWTARRIDAVCDLHAVRCLFKSG